MNVAAIQMKSGDDPAANVAKAFAFVDQAEAELVVLPEVFAHVTRPDDGRIVDRMREKARERRIWLCGSLLFEGYNTALLIRPDGEIEARYRKIHLFDAPGLGNESGYLQAGTEVVTACIGEFRVGLAICYDLRFPELFRTQAADLYLVPSAFSARTGRDHWEILLRARAIENLAYVVAPNQEGNHPNGTTTWGHSMIVDPWGRIVAEAHAEGVITTDVDPAPLAEARRSLPALRHKRLIP